MTTKKNPMDRRTFLKAGALGSASLALSVGMAGNTLAADVEKSSAPNKLKKALPGSDVFKPPNPGDLISMEPTRLFDNFYFVGMQFVGAFVIDTTDGLIMIDTGWGEMDCSHFVNDTKKLGLNPGNIKLILISHEHLDHYGGVQYLKKNVCPDAKVALSQVGLNFVQARTADEKPGGMWAWPKQQSIDMFLTDGQKITLGNTNVQIVYTPGHSPGCVSFILPVTDNGTQHTVGILGGTGVNFLTIGDLYLYNSSIDYFKQFTREAKCDVGLSVHFWGCEAKLAALRVRKPGDANPFVIGTEKFESEYLQPFKDSCMNRIKQLPPEVMPPPPPWIRGNKSAGLKGGS